MIVIGLTGNIATGKSTVLQILEELGAEVIDADRVAHDLMAPGMPAHQGVVAAFGDGVLAPGGTIDRKALGAIVFRDPERLRQLDRIVHPAVVQRIAERLPQITRPVVVIEAIKLIEAGLTALCDEVWVVTSLPETQAARLMATRGLSREEALARINAQPPQGEKAAAARVVIENDGTREQLRARIAGEWERIRRKLPVRA